MTKQELFKQAFGDDDNFINFYFSKRRNKIRLFTHFEQDELCAMVGVLNIDIVANNNTYKCAFLTGVCVEKNHQNKGIMKSFLPQVLKKLSENRYDFAILSPKDENYYLKYGFKPAICGDWLKTNYSKNNSIKAKPATAEDLTLLLNLYNEYCKNFDIYQALTIDDINDLFDEYNQNQYDNILIICKDNIPVGWIVVENDKVTNAVVSDFDILNNIEQAKDKIYFKACANGKKQLFQAIELYFSIPDFANLKSTIFNTY